MKYLGIDYGAKHIGLALSDASGTVAMPHEVVPNNDLFKKFLLELLNTENIESVVIGKSVNLDGTDNTIQADIDAFTVWLASQTDLPIESISELFSSRQAKWGTEHLIRFNPRNKDKRALHKKQSRIDDKAAAILLQSYLDSHTTQ